jgi:hypothetical protein
MIYEAAEVLKMKCLEHLYGDAIEGGANGKYAISSTTILGKLRRGPLVSALRR